MKLYSKIKEERIKVKIINYISSLYSIMDERIYYDRLGSNILTFHHTAKHVSIFYLFIPPELSSNRELLHEVIKNYYNVHEYTFGTSFK